MASEKRWSELSSEELQQLDADALTNALQQAIVECNVGWLHREQADGTQRVVNEIRRRLKLLAEET